MFADFSRSQWNFGFDQYHSACFGKSWLARRSLAIDQFEQIIAENFVPENIR
jgi:hypothetical protein